MSSLKGFEMSLLRQPNANPRGGGGILSIMALTNAIFFYELFSQLPFLNFIEGENQDKTRQLPRLASC